VKSLSDRDNLKFWSSSYSCIYTPREHTHIHTHTYIHTHSLKLYLYLRDTVYIQYIYIYIYIHKYIHNSLGIARSLVCRNLAFASLVFAENFQCRITADFMPFTEFCLHKIMITIIITILVIITKKNATNNNKVDSNNSPLVRNLMEPA